MMNDLDKPATQRRVNVVIDGDVHRKLRHESVSLNQPMATIIQSALKQHFSNQEQSK